MPEPMAILVAEDNADDLEILDACLRRTGHEVQLTRARNGVELLRLLNAGGAEEFHLVLLDLNMPIKDGRQALREMRAKSNRVPVVVLTTSADPADVQESYAAGANAYFVKPHRPDDFTKLLRAILEHWQRAKRPRAIEGYTT